MNFQTKFEEKRSRFANIQNQLPNQSKKQINQPQKVRKNISKYMFGILIICQFVLSFQNIMFYFTDQCDQKAYYVIGVLSLISLTMIGIGRYFVTFKEVFFYYFLLDTLSLSFIVNIIGLMGAIAILQDQFPFIANSFKYLGPICMFCNCGAYRIVIKHANFTRLQNIMFKVVNFANGMCYFGIGVYIMYFEHKLSKGMLPLMDSQFKDFSLLFVFSGLITYKEKCQLHNQFDHTNKLKYKYKLIDQVEFDMETEENQMQI